jgi:hypothetical protein
MSTYYLEPNASGTVFTGSGFSPDGTIPAGAIACTQAQAENPYAYAPDMSTTPPTIVAASSAQLLAQAQTAQIATLYAAYQQAIQTPVSYTSKGGVTKLYQADPGSVSNLQGMLLAFGSTQAAPSGFYWVSADNTQVPFTYADMQGLALALGTQGAAAFQHLQTQKAAILAATTVDAVQAITW